MAPFSLVLAFASMPTTPFVALLLAVICLMVLIMVGMLCARHWVLAAQGSTYVGRLKGEKVAEGGALPPSPPEPCRVIGHVCPIERGRRAHAASGSCGPPAVSLADNHEEQASRQQR